MRFTIDLNVKVKVDNSDNFMLCRTEVAVSEEELQELLSYDTLPLSLEDSLVKYSKYNINREVCNYLEGEARALLTKSSLKDRILADANVILGCNLVVKSYSEVNRYYKFNDDPDIPNDSIYSYLVYTGLIDNNVAAKIGSALLPPLSDEQMWEILVHAITGVKETNFIYEKYAEYVNKYHSTSKLKELPFYVMNIGEYNDKFEEVSPNFLDQIILASYKETPSSKKSYVYPIRKAPFLFKIISCNGEYDKFVEWSSSNNLTLYPEGISMDVKGLMLNPSIKAEYDKTFNSIGKSQSTRLVSAIKPNNPTEGTLKLKNISSRYLSTVGLNLVISSMPPGLRFIMKELPITTETLTEIAKENNISGFSALKKHEMLEKLAVDLPEFTSTMIGYINTSPDAFDTYAPDLSDTDNLRVRLRYISKAVANSDEGGIVSGFLRPLSERISLEHSYGSQILSLIPDWNSEEPLSSAVFIR